MNNFLEKQKELQEKIRVLEKQKELEYRDFANYYKETDRWRYALIAGLIALVIAFFTGEDGFIITLLGGFALIYGPFYLWNQVSGGFEQERELHHSSYVNADKRITESIVKYRKELQDLENEFEEKYKNE